MENNSKQITEKDFKDLLSDKIERVGYLEQASKAVFFLAQKMVEQALQSLTIAGGEAVYRQRFISKGELPEDEKDYLTDIGYAHCSRGIINYWFLKEVKGKRVNPKWWLEPLQLPKQSEIGKSMEKCKDEVAKKYGYEKFYDLFEDHTLFEDGEEAGINKYINEAMQLYASQPKKSIELPSDEEVKLSAKEWASSFEGKERLAMESAHYSGQVSVINKLRSQITSAPTKNTVKLSSDEEISKLFIDIDYIANNHRPFSDNRGLTFSSKIQKQKAIDFVKDWLRSQITSTPTKQFYVEKLSSYVKDEISKREIALKREQDEDGLMSRAKIEEYRNGLYYYKLFKQKITELSHHG